MNKFVKWLWIALLTTTVILGGCNQSNKTETKKAENVSLSTSGITIYIDKNCENAGIQQCNPQIWKQQFAQILKNKPLNIEYINKADAEKFRKLVWTSPVLVVPTKDVSLFGPQAQAIEQTAKQENGNYYVPLYSWIPGEENLCNDGKDNNGDGKVDAQDPTCYKMVALTSDKCDKPFCNPQALKNMFMGYSVNVVNYNSTTWKVLYDQLKKLNWKQNLPTFLLEKEHDYMKWKAMADIIKPVNIGSYKYQINIPQFNYDPSIEACAKDCNASPACKKLLTCAKSDKPNVELFVMSHCPFGTQAEKGIIPAVKALNGKINFDVKFVNYSMHGKKELDENTLQYCIQKEENSKYIPYLQCFLEKWDTQTCEQKVGLDMNKINKCISEADKEYNITKNYNDKASWAGGRFPKYEVDDKENIEYWVQGSPTLIINWVKVQPASRSPEAYLKTICKAFTNPPAECQKVLSDKSYDPGFGWTQNGKAAPAGSCGN